MSLKSAVELVRSGFFRWGWLAPAFLPLASVAGRGAFNILGGVYFLWALASVSLAPAKTSAIWQQRWFLASVGGYENSRKLSAMMPVKQWVARF